MSFSFKCTLYELSTNHSKNMSEEHTLKSYSNNEILSVYPQIISPLSKKKNLLSSWEI